MHLIWTDLDLLLSHNDAVIPYVIMTVDLRSDSLNLIYNFIKQNNLNRRSKIERPRAALAVTAENLCPI
jgi:hypothetical protein